MLNDVLQQLSNWPYVRQSEHPVHDINGYANFLYNASGIWRVLKC